MRRTIQVLIVLTTLAAAVTVGLPTVYAQWPITCVELNDMVERQRGQPGNAGIYQRVYGDAAETHCQADHQEDVQRAFWWALGEGPPPAAAAKVPWPTTCVDLNDVVEAQLGNDTSVGIYQRAYGDGAETACQSDHRGEVRQTFWWAVPAPEPAPTPIAAVVSAPTPAGPFIDPALQHVWDRLMVSIRSYTIYDRWLAANQALTVRFGDPGPGTDAAYRWFRHEIIISDHLRYERTEALVALLAHELWHAVSPIPFPGTFAQCVADEVWAFLYELLVWLDQAGTGSRPDSTNLERGLNDLVWVFIQEVPLGAFDFDEDVSDFPHMLTYVLDDRGYAESCAA